MTTGQYITDLDPAETDWQTDGVLLVQNPVEGSTPTSSKVTWSAITALLDQLYAEIGHDHDADYVAYAHAGAGGSAHANVIAGGAAGFMTGSDKTKLDGIEPAATADQTDAEIETAYNNQVPIVDQITAETGTSTTPYRWTPQRVKQAIDALAAPPSESAMKAGFYGLAANQDIANGTTATVLFATEVKDFGANYSISSGVLTLEQGKNYLALVKLGGNGKDNNTKSLLTMTIEQGHSSWTAISEAGDKLITPQSTTASDQRFGMSCWALLSTTDSTDDQIRVRLAANSGWGDVTLLDGQCQLIVLDLSGLVTGGGGGGVSTFLALTDTPDNFAGNSLKTVRVNTGETALEFGPQALEAGTDFSQDTTTGVLYARKIQTSVNTTQTNPTSPYVLPATHAILPINQNADLTLRPPTSGHPPTGKRAYFSVPVKNTAADTIEITFETGGSYFALSGARHPEKKIVAGDTREYVFFTEDGGTTYKVLPGSMASWEREPLNLHWLSGLTANTKIYDEWVHGERLFPMDGGDIGLPRCSPAPSGGSLAITVKTRTTFTGAETTIGTATIAAGNTWGDWSGVVPTTLGHGHYLSVYTPADLRGVTQLWLPMLCAR